MSDRFDYYYVTDSCELTCANCALEDAKQQWEKDPSDAARRLLALIRLDQPNGLGPIYGAGCRRFTLEQALQHWSDPNHPDPTSAEQLFDGVIRHAIERALRMIARTSVR